MAEMVFLHSTNGSRVVVVGCPVCERISRQILRTPHNGEAVAEFPGEQRCPICGTGYSSCSNAQSKSWALKYSDFSRNATAYNDRVKRNYSEKRTAHYNAHNVAAPANSSELVRETVNSTAVPSANDPKPHESQINVNTSKCENVSATEVQSSDSITPAGNEHIETETPSSFATIPFSENSTNGNTDALDRKIQYWKSKLLDLSKRNRMINYRETKRSTLKILQPDFEELFNRLAINEEELTFQRPVDKDSDLRTFSMLSLMETLAYPLPVQIGDIKTEGSILERQRTLKNLRSKSKLAREEQGTNILYLSFGFIEWREKSTANSPWYKAPLLMMPVSLNIEALNAPYKLSRYDDEIEVNPTLDYLFNNAFGIDLPTFELRDSSSISQYMDAIEEIVDMQGWKLCREISLGLLSFLKISMYHDLENHRSRLLANPIMRAISGDPNAIQEIPEEYNNYDFDKASPTQWFQVVNSDSSQQEAILLSKLGVSFVMQGPPGTGKSQTITNIIAEGLADGKKILFVSEKAAALQVVLRRLSEVHLDDFCLSLHSHKANKREILDSIGSNLKLRHAKVKDSVLAELTDLFHNREHLNRYAHELHDEVQPLGDSLYTAYGKISQLEGASRLPFVIDDPLSVSDHQYNSMLYCVGSFEKAFAKLEGMPSECPWYGSTITNAGEEFQSQFTTTLDGFDSAVHELSTTLHNYRNEYGYDIPVSYAGAEQTQLLFDAILATPEFPAEWLEAGRRCLLITTARIAKDATSQYLSNRSNVETVFDSNVFEFDIRHWIDDVTALVTELQKFGARNGYDIELILSSASKDLEISAALLTNAKTLAQQYSDVQKLLGLSLPDTFENVSRLVEICEMVLSNVATKSEWFDTFHREQAIKKLSQAREHGDKHNSILNELMQNWDTSVLAIDADAMLTRFKTEYQNIFKFLKSSYRTDIKAIKACHKTVGAKIDDTDAIALLQTLQALNAEKQWFAENEVSLSQSFGTHYCGVNSDWESISNGLAVAGAISNIYPNGLVSNQVSDLVCQKSTHTAECNAMMQYCETAQKANVESILAGSEAICSHINNYQSLPLSDTFIPVLSEFNTYCNQLNSKLKELQNYFVSETAFNEYLRYAEQVLSVKEAKQALESNKDQYTEYYQERYCGLDTDWDCLICDLEKVDAFCTSAHYAPSTYSIAARASNSVDVRKDLTKAREVICTQLDAHRSQFDWFIRLFDSTMRLEEMDLFDLEKHFSRCAANLASLEYWLDYIETKDECKEAGLTDFVSKVEAAEYKLPDVLDAFKYGFYHSWITAVVENKPAIKLFRRRIQEERINRFNNLDARQLTIAQARIHEKVISKFPDPNRVILAHDELSVLNRELGKKRRIMPLRRLFREIPKLLLTLKPCLMMSPLSVAYFLEADSYEFDMVIFDEASQIFPQDAIGAIFRGKQVIIAGDSKQLPPTNFFANNTSNSNDNYDDDEDEYEEIVHDSILEETVSVLPSRTLLWHYRSKHEHLIAFSNQEIYKNELVTFPSCRESEHDSGVEFEFVADGLYDNTNKKNCNIPEANRCVELVRQHIEQHPERSLGIIAFSEKQQQAISRQIQQFREENPQYEEFFAEGKEEEFFVKNLENVQGDERDTIIFSICYAKTAEQKAQGKPMRMNFGPLGHSGGERRLNVAITRAKRNVKLVSSILPSDIDLTKTESEGIRMLRAYIEFAMNGSVALRKGKTQEANDDFVDSVCEFISERGYAVQKHVGCSGYKVDIAVEHPNHPGIYIAGIECDGFAYASAKTARDRDHLRSSVLQSMGWNMHRIWSVEWFNNASSEKEKLLLFIKEALAKFTLNPQTPAVHPVPVSYGENDEPEDLMEFVATTSTSKQPVDSRNPYGFDYYKSAEWYDAPNLHKYYGADRALVEIMYIVEMEQPISKELLYQRMAGAYGNQKATNVIRNEVDYVLRTAKGRVVVEDAAGFLTVKGFNALRVRIPEIGETQRPIQHICKEELGLALVTVASRTFGIGKDDLLSETAKALGYARRGEKIQNALNEAFQWLIKTNQIQLIDGKVNVLKK